MEAQQSSLNTFRSSHDLRGRAWWRDRHSRSHFPQLVAHSKSVGTFSLYHTKNNEWVNTSSSCLPPRPIAPIGSTFRQIAQLSLGCNLLYRARFLWFQNAQWRVCFTEVQVWVWYWKGKWKTTSSSLSVTREPWVFGSFLGSCSKNC